MHETDDHELHYLKPGEMLVSSVPLLVTTVLGSCVAVTMFSLRHKLGAICHAQLPTCGTTPCDRRHSDAGKYVDCAVSRMLEKLAAKGVGRKEIRAKVFGGSEMFDSRSRDRTVGRQNIEAARRILALESIPVVGEDLGGERGRKIIFNTGTGEVFLKRLGKSGICE